MKKKGIFGISTAYSTAMLLLASSLLVSCGKKESQATVEPVKVKEMIIGEDRLMSIGNSASADGTQTNSNASANFNYSGTVEEENGSALSFTTGGTIMQLRVKVGDRVRKGQLIASVDPTSIRNSYEMAHATKMQAEDAYKRLKQLHDKGSLPDIKWVEVQSQLQQATSAENIARKSLGDCHLYAPFSGVISEKYAEVGQNAAPGMPIVKLVTTNVLNVKISVPESEVASIHIRQRARIQVQALDGKQYEGYVIEKGIIADPVSRSYDVKIRVEGVDKALLPGMVSQVSLAKMTTSPSSDSGAAIVIPASLIQLADDNSRFVWIDEGGKAVRRSITLGEYQSNGVIITSGLKQGDKLIVEGQQKVCSNTKVKNEE